MRALLLAAVLAALPCRAQDIPDPGRRLSPEEQNADPSKPRPADKNRSDAQKLERERAARVCANARLHYQLSCGPQSSHRESSMNCAEAYAIYRQSCP